MLMFICLMLDDIIDNIRKGKLISGSVAFSRNSIIYLSNLGNTKLNPTSKCPMSAS